MLLLSVQGDVAQWNTKRNNLCKRESECFSLLLLLSLLLLVLSLFQFAVVLQQQQQEQQQQQKQQQYQQQQQQQQAALDRIFKEAISEEAWPGLLLLLVAGMFLVLLL